MPWLGAGSIRVQQAHLPASSGAISSDNRFPEHSSSQHRLRRMGPGPKLPHEHRLGVAVLVRWAGCWFPDAMPG